MIKNTSERIINIALECGFNNISYFNRSFKKKYGISPTEYRAKKRAGLR
jgi:AraC-like DNA-binding protein